MTQVPIHTRLRSVDCIATVGLMQGQVNAAFGLRAGSGAVRLPEGLTAPEHGHVADEAEEDSAQLFSPFHCAWEAHVVQCESGQHYPR